MTVSFMSFVSSFVVMAVNVDSINILCRFASLQVQTKLKKKARNLRFAK